MIVIGKDSRGGRGEKCLDSECILKKRIAIN